MKNENTSGTQKMVVGVYISKHPTDGRFVETLELPHNVGEHHKDKNFKGLVRELVASRGYVVEVVSILVEPQRGVNVTVGVRKKSDAIPAPNRTPVTIAGRPIGSNRGGRKTMTQKQRERRRGGAS